MNEKELQIGETYKFFYKKETPSKEKNKPVKTKLNDTVINDFAQELQKNKQQIQESFENKLSRYKKEVSPLIVLTEFQKEERKLEKRKKLKEEEIQHLNKLEEVKEELFPKVKEEKSNRQKAIDLFFRAYKPENMQIDENGDQAAIYVGPRLTTKGNITHNWVTIKEAVLEQDKIPQEAHKYLSEIVSL